VEVAVLLPWQAVPSAIQTIPREDPGVVDPFRTLPPSKLRTMLMKRRPTSGRPSTSLSRKAPQLRELLPRRRTYF